MSAKKKQINREKLLESPVNFLAFGLGAGLVPQLPGTAGTLVAVPVYCLLVWMGPTVYATVTLIGLLAGVTICDRAARSVGVHDHSGIVWDEMVGFWIAMSFLPFSWLTLVAGFLLFRLFDIAKPWPIRQVDERVRGGLGVMLDDVIAGIFSNIVLRVLLAMGLL